MSSAVQKSFDLDRVNPFEFKYSRTITRIPLNLIFHALLHTRFVRLCHSREELDAVPKPMVVLATTASLEWGYKAARYDHWLQVVADVFNQICTGSVCRVGL